MFPDKDRSYLSEALRHNNYDLQATVELVLTNPNFSPLPEMEHLSNLERTASSKDQEPFHGAFWSGPVHFQSHETNLMVRLVVLVGLPGSGKSTFSKNFAECGWTVVCQDILGDRRACEVAVDAALQAGGRVVVDRTNIDAAQRAHWVRIARSRDIGPAQTACVYLDIRPGECKRRILARVDHPTLPATAEGAAVVWSFRRRQQPPASEEGFGMVLRVCSEADARSAARELLGPEKPQLRAESPLRENTRKAPDIPSC